MKNLIPLSFALMAFSTSACSTPAKTPASKGRVIEFQSDASGFNTRTFFYEAQNEVIAFDAQFTSELAQKSIQHLRQFTNKPISWLVITHPNPDKFNGASVFKAAGAKIVASKATQKAIPEVHRYKEYFFVEVAKMFKKGQYPQPIVVDHVFTNKMDLVLQGGERVSLQELSAPGISSTQTVAYVPSAEALFVGDLIHYKAHAWLEGGIVNGKPTPTLKGWLADLQELKSLYPAETKVFGGRGLTTDLKTSILHQTEYLQTAVLLINQELSELGAQAQDFTGPNASELYKNLAQKFQARYPEYAWPYLIEYGAYGLVQHQMNLRK